MLPLSDIAVLVTRPAHQAGNLISGIERAGGRAIAFPVIEIGDMEDDGVLKSILARLDEFDVAIFISPNAVEHAIGRIKALPAGLRLVVIGKSSLVALKAFGAQDALVPERSDSEGLLELPELSSVGGLRIVIFRGVGGREMLGDELTARGAIVEYAECYRRLMPAAHAALKEAALQAVTATSGEGVRNLLEMTKDSAWIRKKPIFVPHERIGRIATEAGFEQVVVTESGDDGLLQGLINWFKFGEMAHGNG